MRANKTLQNVVQKAIFSTMFESKRYQTTPKYTKIKFFFFWNFDRLKVITKPQTSYYQQNQYIKSKELLRRWTFFRKIITIIHYLHARQKLLHTYTHYYHYYEPPSTSLFTIITSKFVREGVLRHTYMPRIDLSISRYFILCIYEFYSTRHRLFIYDFSNLAWHKTIKASSCTILVHHNAHQNAQTQSYFTKMTTDANWSRRKFFHRVEFIKKLILLTSTSRSKDHILPKRARNLHTKKFNSMRRGSK